MKNHYAYSSMGDIFFKNFQNDSKWGGEGLGVGEWHDSVKGGNVAWAWPYQGHIMRGLENKQGPHMNLALACKHTWARRHKVWCGCNNTRHGCGIHNLIKQVDSHMGKQNNKWLWAKRGLSTKAHHKHVGQERAWHAHERLRQAHSRLTLTSA